MAAVNLDLSNSKYSDLILQTQTSELCEKIGFVIGPILQAVGLIILGITIADKIPLYGYGIFGALVGGGFLITFTALYFSSLRENFYTKTIISAIPKNEIEAARIKYHLVGRQEKLEKLTKIAIKMGFFDIRNGFYLLTKKFHAEIDKIHIQTALAKADLTAYGNEVIHISKKYLTSKSH